MGLTDQVVQGIKNAKSAIGDLVEQATLVQTSSVLDPVAGINTQTPTNTTVDVVPNQKSLRYRFLIDQVQGEDLSKSDLNLIVFNLDNLFTMGDSDRIVYRGRTYKVNQLNPIPVGSVTPIYLVGLVK